MGHSPISRAYLPTKQMKKLNRQNKLKLKEWTSKIATLTTLLGVILLCTTPSAKAGMTIQFYGDTFGLGTAIPGAQMQNLYEDDQFPDQPGATEGVTAQKGFGGAFVDASTGYWEWPQPFAQGNWQDNYGAVMTGVWYVPQSGDYRFFIRSDDSSELFITEEPLDLESLKGDDAPEPDAFEADCCDAFEEGDTATATFALEAGDIRYITFIFKEAGSGDWAQLGHNFNGSSVELFHLGNVQRHIFTEDAPAEEFPIMAAFGPDGEQWESDVPVPEAQNVSFYVEFDTEISSADEAPEITWSLDGEEIEGQKGSMLTLFATMDLDGSTVTANIDGIDELSMTITIEPDFDAPTVSSIRTQGNPAGVLVTFNEGVSEESATNTSNYEIEGKTISSATLISSNQVLLDIGAYDGSLLEITITGVEDQAFSPNQIEEVTLPVVMTDGLIIYLPLDEDTNDLLGRYNGENQSVDFTNDGDRGDVAEFSQENAHINLGVVDDLQGGVTEFSFSAWFLRTEDNAGDNTNHAVSNVLAAHSATPTNDDFEIGTSGPTVEAYMDTVGGRNGNLPVAPAGIENDVWNHILFVYDGSTNPEVKIYVNGDLVLEDERYGRELNDGSAFNATPWTIGVARPDRDDPWGDFTGLMDDVAFWRAALTPAMAAALADGTASPLNVGAAVTGELTIATPLANQEVNELSDAVFSADIEGSDPSVVVVEWYRDGELIPGTSGTTLTIPSVGPSDSGAIISFIAYNSNGSFNRIASEEATLTVINDETSPSVVSISATGFGVNQIVVNFDETLDQESAEKASNYIIDAMIPVESATLLAGGTSVLLETGDLEKDGEYNLVITGVEDLSAAGNATDIKAPFTEVSNYEIIVQSDDPIRYWRLNDDVDSTTVAEIAVGGNDGAGIRPGTVAAGVTFGASSLIFSDGDNKAADFSAVDGEINVPNGNDVNIANGPWGKKSFEAWIKPNSFPPLGATGAAAAMGVFEQGGNDRALGAFIWRLPEDTDPNKAHLVFFAFNRLTDAGGVGSPWFEPADGSDGIYVSHEISIGSTYHVVGVMDGNAEITGSKILYVNGEAVDEVEGVGLLYNHSGDVHIGRGDMKLPDNSTGIWLPFDGVIDEVALYNTALTEEQVQRHFDIAFLGNQSGPAEIVSSPTSITAEERTLAEFSAEFSGAQPIEVTWTVNGQLFAGNVDGNTATLAIPTTIDLDGAQIQVTVKNDDGEDSSEEASLTVTPETTPPTVVSIEAIGGESNIVTIAFSEDLDEASATNAANYTIEGLTVTGASIDGSLTQVTLTTSQQETGKTYSLEIGDLKDGSSTGNAYSAGAVSIKSIFNYQLAVMSDNPDGYFPLGETEGTVASNLAFSNWNGTYAVALATEPPVIGVDKIVPGSPDTAAQFANNRVNLPDNARLNTGGPYSAKTIELWFKATSLPRSQGDGVAAQKAVLWEQGGATRGISIYLSGTEEENDPEKADLYFHIWNRGDNDGPGAPWGFDDTEPTFVKTEVNLNENYHIVMVYDGSEELDEEIIDFVAFQGTLKGYVNGELVDEKGGLGLLYNHGDDGAIGMIRQNVVYHDAVVSIPSGDPFFGIIDEVATYNKVLEEDRIAYHYEIGTTPLDTPSGEGPAFSSFSSDGTNITMEWTDGKLESAPSAVGPWTPMDAQSPHTEAIAVGAKFFRLVQ